MAGGRERRIQDRERTLLEIEYGDREAFISDFALNISKGGMFISTPEPLGVGAELNVRFKLPNARDPIQLRAKVMWVNPVDRKSKLIPGMGVSFQDLTEERRKEIEHYIQTIQVGEGASRES